MKINYADFKKQKINSKFKTKVYDFIIIGSGPAAITLYKKIILKNKKMKILILEEGNFNNKNYKSVLSKYLKIDFKSRAFTIGGTSSIWSNISSYFEDFEMRSRWRNKRSNLWPLTHKSLIKEYRKLNQNYEFNFKKLKNKKINIPFQLRPFVATTKPINFKKFINFDEIDLIFNCKIDTIDEKKNYTLAFTKNDSFSFKAKKIIISCGGIESVRLVQNSLKKKKLMNIKNKNLVGKFFMDHPKFDLGYIKYPKKHIINQIELKKKNNIIFYYGVSLKREFQLRKNLLNTYVRFEKSNNRIYRFLETLNIPILKTFISKKNIFRVRIFCEMKPNIKNLITSKKTKTMVKLKLSKIDYDTIKILSNKIKFFFSFHPKKEKNFISKNFEKQIKNASHHMGGLRFDPNSNLSVVNKNLKVIGLRNTYICSSAIFPTSGSVNPTMTICALGSRLGDYLTK